MIQKEIEAALKAGLKTEDDYIFIQNLYGAARLPEQGKMVNAIKKEKFPQGKWIVNEILQKVYTESDPAKKEAILAEMISKSETDSNWKDIKLTINNYKSQLPYTYITKKDWEGFKKSVEKNVIDKNQMASLYNNTAWEMQKTSTDLKTAEEISKFLQNTQNQNGKNLLLKSQNILPANNGNKIVKMHIACTPILMLWCFIA